MRFKWTFSLLFGLFFTAFLSYYVTLSLRPLRTPQVYDCFLFYNELELLEVRLNEMAPFVDKFVLVEAGETFRGSPKPYYFEENRHRFEKFADKIIHVKVEQPLHTDNPWVRERHQREQVFQGLTQCHPQDIILLSDADEIVRGSCLPHIRELLSSHKAQVVVCEQEMYHGFLNRFQAKWRGAVATTFKMFERLSTKHTRRLRNMHPKLLRKAHVSQITCLPHAGWHFTSMGGVERQIMKLESYSHREFDRPELKVPENILHIFRTHPLVEIDSSFPQFIVDNKKHFQEIGFIDTPS